MQGGGAGDDQPAEEKPIASLQIAVGETEEKKIKKKKFFSKIKFKKLSFLKGKNAENEAESGCVRWSLLPQA